MNARRRNYCGFLLIGLVAGCSAGGGGSTTGKSADWAVDACKTFSAAAAGKATGLSVNRAESASAISSEQTALSNCAYSTASGDHFGILLRQDKTGQTTLDQQIQGLKASPAVTGPAEDVAMPKGKAVWASKLHTLSYIPDDARMIVVTPPGALTAKDPAEVEAVKQKAITIAKAIEG